MHHADNGTELSGVDTSFASFVCVRDGMFDPYHPELTTVFHAPSVEEQDTLMHGREE